MLSIIYVPSLQQRLQLKLLNNKIVKKKMKMGKRVIMMIRMMDRITMMKMIIQKRRNMQRSLKRAIKMRK